MNDDDTAAVPAPVEPINPTTTIDGRYTSRSGPSVDPENFTKER
jgi:hypothetical protein